MNHRGIALLREDVAWWGHTWTIERKDRASLPQHSKASLWVGREQQIQRNKAEPSSKKEIGRLQTWIEFFQAGLAVWGFHLSLSFSDFFSLDSAYLTPCYTLYRLIRTYILECCFAERAWGQIHSVKTNTQHFAHSRQTTRLLKFKNTNLVPGILLHSNTSIIRSTPEVWHGFLFFGCFFLAGCVLQGLC